MKRKRKRGIAKQREKGTANERLGKGVRGRQTDRKIDRQHNKIKGGELRRREREKETITGWKRRGGLRVGQFICM